MQHRFSHVVGVVACALAGVAGLASLAHAADRPQPTPIERAVQYRQGVYTAMVWNWGRLVPMMQGKAPYDAKEFERRAERVATLTPMLAEGFELESALPGKSEAKPEIWKNKAEFDKLMQDLVTRTANLAEVSKSGDLARIKPAFADAGKACKTCHDKFKQE